MLAVGGDEDEAPFLLLHYLRNLACLEDSDVVAEAAAKKCDVDDRKDLDSFHCAYGGVKSQQSSLVSIVHRKHEENTVRCLLSQNVVH